MRQFTPKPERAPKLSQKVREGIYRRDGGVCVVGDLYPAQGCAGGRTVQHTVTKGMGGSRLFDTPDLLITMCNGHNTLATSSGEFQAFAKARGWVRDRNSNRDPRKTPTLYADGWFYLVGMEREPVNEADALEYMHLIGARKVA